MGSCHQGGTFFNFCQAWLTTSNSMFHPTESMMRYSAEMRNQILISNSDFIAQIEKIEKRLINDSFDSHNRSIIVSCWGGNRFIFREIICRMCESITRLFGQFLHIHPHPRLRQLHSILDHP